MFRQGVLFGAVAAGLAASLAGCAPVGCAGYGGYGGLELYIGGYYGGYRYFGALTPWRLLSGRLRPGWQALRR